MAQEQSAAGCPSDERPDTWDVVAARLDDFLARWNSAAKPPDIADLLVDVDSHQRPLLLVELVKADMECRATRGKDMLPLEEYLSRFPELVADGVPADLLYEEFHLHKRAGRVVSFDEYRRRFPSAAEALARLIGTSSGSAATESTIKPAQFNIAVGETIAEFQLLRLLGQGTFAKVFLAWQQTMQRTVALKVSGGRGAEPQTLAQLDHPNIVRVFDQRQLPERHLGLLYMTFVPGGSLAGAVEQLRGRPREEWSGRALLDIIDRVASEHGAPPAATTASQRPLHGMSWPQAVCWLGARLATALAYAHGRGVQHRDVKPANILLAHDGEPQLADFNIGSASLPEPGPVALFGGSLAYMAPEHLEAFSAEHGRQPDDLDARCDIYALGITLWEMLTGARPFDDERSATMTDLISARQAGLPATAITTVPPDCPPGLIDVLRRCLEADSARRYQSAGELGRALELCLHPETQALVQPTPGGWRALVRRHPIIVMALLGVAPNLITSALNIRYNQAAVIDARPEAQELFQTLILIINGLFFPVGVLLFVVPAWPVARAVRGVEAGNTVAPNEARRARRVCLRLGTYSAIACVVSWVLAGITWPITLDLLSGTLGFHAHVHFLASLTLCGLIGAVYPFFLVSFVAVRVLLPTLLRGPPPEPGEHADLGRLDSALGRNLALAAVVPLVGLAALVGIDSQDRTSMRALTALGLAGCGFAYFLEQRVRGDLTALGHVYRRIE